MNRHAWLLIGSMAVCGVALAAPPTEEVVQGLYEGTVSGDPGPRKFEARVVACGRGTYRIFLRQVGPGDVTKLELEGKADGDVLRFTGKLGNVEWNATFADGAIKGTCGPQGRLELKRVQRPSPTLGAKPPAGAVVLLDGKTFDEVTKNPTSPPWKIVDGDAVEVPKGGMNSKRRFDGSFRLHVEFKCPLIPDARDQGRANSGVYLPNGDEIQVLDSFGMTTYKGGGCGGIYAYKDPDTFDKFSLASAPPLQWQTFDVEYYVPKKDGKVVGKPRVTVSHNGIKIHDNFEVQREARPGGFHFQDHGNPVQYRNIWVLPLDGKP
jgi:hypothetical protein